MNDIRAESQAFRARQMAETENARQLAALHLACGIDLATALTAAPEPRLRLILRLERAIERERLKGMRRHWTYDLNRHIALKQVLDRLRNAGLPPRMVASPAPCRTQKRRRRPKAPPKLY
ncbi:cytoplasmic protein [Mesorhizobium zhangyense]|uniref:cytoplasmic protein n=1 Tax=Mesorhizobium zhangyense TaxID=1776730 RepID=UPI001FE4340F|nr:cytoplasmic protein [Mesorhizobium zhangyense]